MNKWLDIEAIRSDVTATLKKLLQALDKSLPSKLIFRASLRACGQVFDSKLTPFVFPAQIRSVKSLTRDQDKENEWKI